MGSGNQQDRIPRLVKLLYSLLKLVMEDKRHLETVSAALQRLVFTTSAWPTYKNWPEICKLPANMMFVVALLDLQNRNDLTEQIIAAFPDCFSDKAVQGPIPLSLIRQRAGVIAAKEGVSFAKGEETPETRGFPWEYNIPVIPLAVTEQALEAYPDLLKCLPDSIPANARQGQMVTCEGQNFIVIENNKSLGEMYIVPAECIHLDV